MAKRHLSVRNNETYAINRSFMNVKSQGFFFTKYGVLSSQVFNISETSLITNTCLLPYWKNLQNKKNMDVFRSPYTQLGFRSKTKWPGQNSCISIGILDLWLKHYHGVTCIFCSLIFHLCSPILVLQDKISFFRPP